MAGSVGKGEARLHVTHIQHHPGQPHQHGNHPGDSRKPRGIAEQNFKQTDLFHGLPSLIHPVWLVAGRAIVQRGDDLRGSLLLRDSGLKSNQRPLASVQLLMRHRFSEFI